MISAWSIDLRRTILRHNGRLEQACIRYITRYIATYRDYS